MTLLLRSLALLAVLLAAWPAAPAHATPAPRADQIVPMLDHIAVAYPDTVADGKVLAAGKHAGHHEFVGN